MNQTTPSSAKAMSIDQYSLVFRRSWPSPLKPLCPGKPSQVQAWPGSLHGGAGSSSEQAVSPSAVSSTHLSMSTSPRGDLHLMPEASLHWAALQAESCVRARTDKMLK